MFDVGAPELLVIIIVAIVVIGPKDMPVALRTAGRWIGKIRRMSNHFRSGVETMIREAELEEMEKKWREHNRKVMEEHPAQDPAVSPSGEALPAPAPASMEIAPDVEGGEVPPSASAEARSAPAAPDGKPEGGA